MDKTESVLDLSDFVRSGEKKYGITEGFVATKEGYEYMVKQFKNGNLTEEEFKARKERFKQSLLLSSAIKTKKILSDLKDEDIYRYYERRYQQSIEATIIEDDLNIADCIREYLSSPIYEALLGDDAPKIYLVKDDNDPTKIYLASKFIPNFTTVLDHIRNQTDSEYINAKGYERILAAQLLLGELDIIQTGNYGVISEKNQAGHFGKIDHGRSMCKQKYNSLSEAKSLNDVRDLGIGIKAYTLQSELDKQAKILDKHRKKIESQIKERVKNLEKVFNHDLIFTLRTFDKTADDKASTLVMTKFHYEKEHFISNDGKTLEEYFIAEFRRYKDRSNFLASNPSIINSKTICLISSATVFASGILLAKFYQDKIIDKLGKHLQNQYLPEIILGTCIFGLCTSFFVCLHYLSLNIELYYSTAEEISEANSKICELMDGKNDNEINESFKQTILDHKPSSRVTPTDVPEQVATSCLAHSHKTKLI